MLTITVIIFVGLLILLGFAILSSLGYDYFKVITLRLDEMYDNTNEMVCAVFAELKKQGRECEVLEMGKGYPKFLVDGKKYLMTYKTDSMGGFPVQTIKLKKLP